MNTTFESTNLRDLNYEDAVAAVCATLLELADYARDIELPAELRDYTSQLEEIAGHLTSDQQGVSYAEIDIPPNSPQQVASKILKAFHLLERIIGKALNQPDKNNMGNQHAKLTELRENMSKQSIRFERFIWLGRI